jgi:hypothetical protein
VSLLGCRERVEQVRRETRAGVPHLDRDELARGAVVVAKATGHALADHVVGVARGEPGDGGDAGQLSALRTLMRRTQEGGGAAMPEEGLEPPTRGL